MIKFFGEPLKEIKSKLTNKVVFRFDSAGTFITEDPEIIKRAMGHFDYIEMKGEEVGAKVKKTVEVEKITITVNEPKNEEPKEEGKEFKCDKCSFETNNKGAFISHTKSHKDGDK